MDIATLGLEIRSDGVVIASKRLKDLDGAAKSAERSAKDLGNATKNAGSATSQAESSFAKLHNTVSGMATGFKALQGAVIVAASAMAAMKIAEFATGFIQTAASMERLRIGLDTVTGSAATGKAAFQWIIDFSRETPFQIEAVSKSFISLVNTGINPTEKAMKAIGEAVSALGGTDETFMGIATAIGQIAAKGKVSMEELNQLAERGIAARQILAEGLKTSVGDLEKYLQKSGTSAQAALDVLFDGMIKKYGGSMDRMESSFDGMVGALKQMWQEFELAIADEGAFDAVKNIIGEIKNQIEELKKTGELQEWATNIAKGILIVLRAALEFVDYVGASIEEIKWIASGEFGKVFEGMKNDYKVANIPEMTEDLNALNAELIRAYALPDSYAGKFAYIADTKRQINELTTELERAQAIAAKDTGIKKLIGDVNKEISVLDMGVITVTGDTGKATDALKNLGNSGKPQLQGLSESAQKAAEAFGKWRSEMGAKINIEGLTGSAKAAAELEAEIAKLIKQYPKHEAEIRKLVTEYSKLQEANKTNSELEKLRIELMKMAAEQTKEDVDVVRDKIKAEGDLTEAYEKLHAEMKKRIDTAGMTEAQKKTYELEEQIKDLTETQKENIRTQAAQATAAEDAAEKSKIAYDKWKDAVTSVANSVENTLSDVFYGMLTGAKDTFENILDSLKRFISQMLAEIATRKILVPIYAGLFGLGSSDLSSLTGSSSGGILDLVSSLFGGSGGGSSLLGTGSSILSGISSLFGGGSSLSGVSLTAALSGGVASSASTGIFSSISSLFSTVAPLVGVAALAIPLISSLFEDRPQPEFNTTGTVPGTFSEFLSANPEDLLTVDWMNADAEESSGTDAAAIQSMYSTVIKGFQDTFSGIYEVMPDAVKEAWDAVSGEAWTNVMESTRATTSLAITGHLKLWVSGFNTYMVQALVTATADAFSTSMFGDSSGTQKLTDTWLTKITSWFDEKLIASTEDTLDELLTTYGEVLTNFFGGIADIMTYSSIDLNTAWEDAYGYTATPYKDAFESAVKDIDENISDLTASLDSLSGEDYATAIANIGTALEERYTLEMEYITAIKDLISDIMTSIEETQKDMYLDTMTSGQEYEFWTGQANTSYQRAMNATSAEDFAYWYSQYSTASQTAWSMLPEYTASQNPTTTSEITYGDRSSPFDLGYTTTYTTTYPTVDEEYSTGVYSGAYPAYSQRNVDLGYMAGYWGVTTVEDVQTGHDTIADSTAAAITGLDDFTDTTSKTVTELDSLNTSISDLAATVVTANGNIATSAASLVTIVNSLLGTDYEVNA